MGTIQTLLQVKADASQAVRGLAPLQTSLEKTSEDAKDLEESLGDLDKQHRVDLDSEAIDRARRDIEELQQQMRRDIAVGVDTRLAQRRIRELKSAVRVLDAQRVDIEVTVDTHALRNVAETLSTTLGTFGGTLGRTAGLAGQALGPIAVGLGLVGAAAGVGTVAVLKLSDQMAQSKIAFTQFLGNAKKADVFLAHLSAFAAKTPFEFPELVQASKTLLAFGVGSEDLIGLMTTLGDAAALTGSEVENLTTIWGQMSAKGKVSNEELMQLTENGIPAYRLLADAIGKTVPEISKMAEKGQLLSDDVLPVLQRKLNETFGGGMAKQAETLSGKFSTFMDNIKGLGTSLGEAFSPTISAALDGLSDKLTEISNWARENRTTIAAAFISVTAVILRLGAGITDFFGAMLTGFGTVVDKIGTVIGAIGINMQALQGIPGIPDDFGDSVVRAADNIQALGEDMKGTADDLHGFADGMRDTADKVIRHGVRMARGFQADDLRAKIKHIKDDLQALGEKPPTPVVDAKIEAAEKKLKGLQKDLDRITRRDRLITVNADIREALRHKDQIQDALENLEDQPHTVKVKADIKEWEAKLRTVDQHLGKFRETRATITGDADTKDAKGDLDDTAKPGGKPRKAPVHAQADTKDADRDLNNFIKLRRTTTVHVNVIPILGPILEGLVGPTAGPSSLVGASASMMAAPTPSAVTPWSTAGIPGTGGQQQGGSSPQIERLSPKTTPVAVYLDGVEIAHRIEARRALAATTSVRRSA